MIQVIIAELAPEERNEWHTRLLALRPITQRVKDFIDLGYAVSAELNTTPDNNPWAEWPVKWWINFEDEGEASLFKLKYL